MNKQDVQQLLEHMWWADAQIDAALSVLQDPPARAVGLYAHVLGAELTWLDRIEGAAQSTAVWPALDLARCKELASRDRERYQAFLETLSPEILSQTIHYANTAGQEFDTRLDDILVHVALHGSYHRGQIAMVLRDSGADPKITDYIAFVRSVPDAARRAVR